EEFQGHKSGRSQGEILEMPVGWLAPLSKLGLAGSNVAAKPKFESGSSRTGYFNLATRPNYFMTLQAAFFLRCSLLIPGRTLCANSSWRYFQCSDSRVPQLQPQPKR